MKKIFLLSFLLMGATAANAVAPPFSENFDSSAGGFEARDANNDGVTFTRNTSYNGFGYSTGCFSFNSANAAADDWLVTPGIELKGGYSYKVNYKFKGSSDTPFSVEWFVSGADGDNFESQPIFVSEDTGNRYDYFDRSFTVTAEADGVYRLGLHLTSNVNQGIYYIDNFSIESGVNPAMPTSPVVEGPDYIVDLENDKVDVAFNITAPTTNRGNAALSGNVTINVTRNDDSTILYTAEVAPGDVWNFVDTNAVETSVVYTVVAVVDGFESDPVNVTSAPVFSAPAAVQNFVVEHDGAGGFTLSWDPVTEGGYSGLFIPSRVRYTIKCGNTVVAENIEGTTTSYTYEYGDEPGQAAVSFTITASASGKTSTATTSQTFFVGKPYTGQFAESFAGRAFSTTPWTSELNASNWATSIGSSYSPAVDPQDGDGGLLTTNNSYEARIVSPLIDMKDEVNPMLKFFMWQEKGYYYDASVTVGFRSGDTDYDQETFKTATDDASGWKEITVAVPAEVVGDVFQIYFYTPGNYGKVFIDNITVKSYRDYSVAVQALEAPEKAEIGQVIDLVAKVENLGIKDAENYSVEFFAGDQLIETVECETLAAQTQDDLSLKFTVTPRYAGTDIEFRAVLNFDLDEVNDDNEAVAVVTVNENDLTTVPEIKAIIEQETKYIVISWDTPEVSSDATVEIVAEDFEGDEWVINSTEGVNGWTFTGTDGQIKYIFGNYNYPVYDAMVYGSYVPSYGTAFYPHSGDKALILGKYAGYSYPAPATDSWIISPEVAPGSEVSFYAAGWHSYSSYSDKLTLMYSEGGTEMDDFTAVATFSISTGSWTECQATLPAAAKRFAIRFNGNMNNYNIAIDDIIYSAYGAPAVHTGYNLYRDHQLLATLDSKTNGYTDKETELVNPSYYITALYDKGESMPSETIYPRLTEGVENVDVDSAIKTDVIYNLQGIAVDPSRITPGIYIINGSKVLVK